KGTKLEELYLPLLDEDSIVNERHRHRYELNPDYVARLEAAGMQVSGYTPGSRGRGAGLVEAIELRGHPFYVGLQSHPEFTSRLMRPSPPFTGFIRAAVERSDHTTAADVRSLA
ncbi:MAG TPA: CTP synthetase, partial [Trueperaceae bacterium]|nr:CTP synthetase [Trueperaceae bacterium]